MKCSYAVSIMRKNNDFLAIYYHCWTAASWLYDTAPMAYTFSIHDINNHDFEWVDKHHALSTWYAHKIRYRNAHWNQPRYTLFDMNFISFIRIITSWHHVNVLKRNQTEEMSMPFFCIFRFRRNYMEFYRISWK